MQFDRVFVGQIGVGPVAIAKFFELALQRVGNRILGIDDRRSHDNTAALEKGTQGHGLGGADLSLGNHGLLRHRRPHQGIDMVFRDLDRDGGQSSGIGCILGLNPGIDHAPDIKNHQ